MKAQTGASLVEQGTRTRTPVRPMPRHLNRSRFPDVIRNRIRDLLHTTVDGRHQGGELERMGFVKIFTSKSTVKGLSYFAFGIPAVTFLVTTALSLFSHQRDSACAVKPKGDVESSYHWTSLDGPQPPGNMFPAGGDVLRWLLAVHVVPRAILAGVVTWYNCNNALHVGGWTQWLYAALVFGNLVADLCATVELSGIGQLLKPGEPHCLSCINFVGYSLVGMAVTCVVLHMRRQGRRCLHGLLLLAFVAAVVMHISLAVHTAHCLEIAQHIFRFCHYGFLLAKLGFDSFILHDMTNVLE